jgi:inorganic pyrophosphatase
MQLIVSTVLLLGVIYIAAEVSYPASFKLVFNSSESEIFGPWAPYVCSVLGLVSGMIIAAFTEYVTSHSYKPVR